MGAFKSAIITKKGQALLTKALAGDTELKFVSIKTSEAILSGDLASKTGIGTIKQVANVTSIIRQNDSAVKVSGSFSNIDLKTGYYVRNIGLYATDPTEGEILYSISVADESTATADWMPPFNGVGVSSLMVDLVTAVSNASNVNVEVDPTAFATVAQINYLNKRIDDLAHFTGYEEDDIYGVEIDFSSKKITRIAGAEHLTGGADFDALAPWGGRRRCMVGSNGAVLAYYGDEAYAETGSYISIYTGDFEHFAQVMVEQPIFYVKAVPVKATDASSGRGKQYVKARFYISPTPKIGFVAPRAFYDNNGILQDKIYLSAFEGSIYRGTEHDGEYFLEDEQIANFDEDKLSSIAGAKPASGLTQNLTRANARKLCNNRGNGWQLHNIFAMSVTQWLFMVEYASLDPQRKVGRGVSSLTDDGATNMALYTGQTSSIGNGSGIRAGETDGKCSVTYRGEENLWGNIWTWLDGINVLAKCDNSIWVPKIGTAPVDDTTEGYDCMDAHATHSNGYVSSFGIDPQYPEILIPTEASGSDTFADYAHQSYDYDGLLLTALGGKWHEGSKCGFSLYLYATPASHTRYFGARLLYVPQSK